jgi:hypothetical protein
LTVTNELSLTCRRDAEMGFGQRLRARAAAGGGRARLMVVPSSVRSGRPAVESRQRRGDRDFGRACRGISRPPSGLKWPRGVSSFMLRAAPRGCHTLQVVGMTRKWGFGHFREPRACVPLCTLVYRYLDDSTTPITSRRRYVKRATTLRAVATAQPRAALRRAHRLPITATTGSQMR